MEGSGVTTSERLQAVMRDVFLDDELVMTDATTANDISGWDSLRHINFMFAVEQEFGVRFSDDQFHSFSTIGELRQFLETSSG
jgi:acyl carrier protein